MACGRRTWRVHIDPEPPHGHRLEHRHDLRGPDLTDDDPGSVVPQRRSEHVADGDLTGQFVSVAFAVGLPRLERVGDRAGLGARLVQVELTVGFEGDQALGRWDLTAQRTQQRRLSCAHVTDDQDVHLGVDTGGEECLQQRVDRAPLDEFGDAVLADAVLSDDDGGPCGEQRGGHTGAVGHAEADHGGGLGQGPFTVAGQARHPVDPCDQLFVAVGDLVNGAARPVVVLDMGAQPVNHHVLDAVFVQEGLQ